MPATLNPRLLFLLPAAWLLTVAATSSSPSPTNAPPSPRATPTATPAPTPTPSVGQVSLDPTLGPPGGKITVSGSSFRPGEQVNLFWDSADKGLGSATADGQGNFKVDVGAQGGDPGTSHLVCADEKNPGPRCANFVLTAAATPTPTVPPTPLPTSQPTAAGGASAAPTAAPAPESRPVSAVSVLLEPPFVFFPLLLVLAALGGAGFWIWSGTRVARPAPVPAARVVHRSLHPPGTKHEIAPLPRPAAGAPPPRGEEPAPEPLRPLAGDDPLDLPEPGD